MTTIDRADWHYSGDFPNKLPKKNGGTHIGMYLHWIIDNDLMGEMLLENAAGGIQDVKSGKISGRDFLFEYCDEKFTEDFLNEEGLEFTIKRSKKELAVLEKIKSLPSICNYVSDPAFHYFCSCFSTDGLLQDSVFEIEGIAEKQHRTFRQESRTECARAYE